jgi:hypothetical protein
MNSVEYYVKGLFRGLEQTPAIVEQREELAAHIADHISDAVGQGLGEEAAFERAIADLGNLDELIDTITGRRKRVREKRANMFSYLAGFCWGTVYIIAVGFWFAAKGFGRSALFVAVPGWLGFFLPFLYVFIEWLRHPDDTDVIAIDMSIQVRRSLVIWILVSIACFAANFALSRGDTFLHVFWAWMPMAGLFTLPLTCWVYGKALKRDKPPNADSTRQ